MRNAGGCDAFVLRSLRKTESRNATGLKEAVTVERPTVERAGAANKGRRRWHFAGAVLDERALELLVNGVEVELERKPLEVLIYLLQHAGEVCTKDELLEDVWPGRVLSETVLTKCIGRLREVLGDRDQEIIKTAYGFGYRLVAPVTIEAGPAGPEPARFDFRPGDHPPGRPLWSLVERLGVGGHGEAWRARHEKTHDQRVFKFALDGASLGALKREITLFRVINDTLGDSARVVKLLDWNLEHLPYFVEAEYVTEGSLVEWARGRGGLLNIPLAERLEVVARIATALSAVHSVGVLHKDLKPSNVLVTSLAGREVDVLLADFGSGAVVDMEHLERLGITRLGFTKTIAVPETSSGTPMYLAPEILAGQPFTVKADIYALGMILYQFLVGDFHKVMSPGWERDLEDALLCEDVALLAEGNPGLRLADADVLARRLRTLPERRAELAAEREAQEKAERTRRLVERARARRFGLALAFGILVTGLVISTLLYTKARHAQQLSAIAAEQSQAVTDFLSKDVFAPASSGAESVRTLGVIELLNRAGEKIDARFAAQPGVAAELHYVIGKSLYEFYDTRGAANHFNYALSLQSELQGVGSESAVRSAADLVYLDYAVGKLAKTIVNYDRSYEAGLRTLDPRTPALFNLREQLALGHFLLGEWQGAASRLKNTLTDLATYKVRDPILLGHAQLYYGQVLTALGEPERACPVLQSAIQNLTQGLNAKHPDVSEAKTALGKALLDMGKYERAMDELREAEGLALGWGPLDITWTVVRPRFFQALVYLEQGELERARALLSPIVAYQDAHYTGERPEIDRTGSIRAALGEVYLLEGKTTEATKTLRTAVRVSELSSGVSHPTTLSIRLIFAKALLASGDTDQARTVVGSLVNSDPTGWPAGHPYFAQLYEVRGLLAYREGDPTKAKQWLERAARIYEALYGASHWRTQSVQRCIKEAVAS